jgi:hypothetical protein
VKDFEQWKLTSSGMAIFFDADFSMGNYRPERAMVIDTLIVDSPAEIGNFHFRNKPYGVDGCIAFGKPMATEGPMTADRRSFSLHPLAASWRDV